MHSGLSFRNVKVGSSSDTRDIVDCWTVGNQINQSFTLSLMPSNIMSDVTHPAMWPILQPLAKAEHYTVSGKRALLRFHWGWPCLVIVSALFHSYVAWLLHRVVTNAASQVYIRKTWVWSLAPSGSDQFSPLTPANDSVNVHHARIESTAKYPHTIEVWFAVTHSDMSAHSHFYFKG